MPVESDAFKAALSHWASGVTVVTTRAGEQNVGITASAFSSVSLEPPLVSVCIAKKLYTHSVIEESQAFAVNILGTEHLEWGMRFAGMIPNLDDRFVGIAVEQAETGSPLLANALAWLDCRLHAAYDGGDHTIFVGEVLATHVLAEGQPLLYYDRAWRELNADPLTLR
jgi:flavin reductase (DIM6/NTAB) family NADH-FMN oxidoreductase RutF